MDRRGPVPLENYPYFYHYDLKRVAPYSIRSQTNYFPTVENYSIYSPKIAALPILDLYFSKEQSDVLVDSAYY
jgi:hypothetical protein